MTQSPSDKPDIRKYSVIPARAIQDDDLHPTTLRLLGALCLHTNSYGICWPSRITLSRHISRSTKTVSVHVGRLIKAGYVRKLQPKAYPVKAQNTWRTNRYQVLFDGPQTKLPTKEQFYAPRPKLAEDPVIQEQQEVTHNRRGSGGENSDFRILAQAFCQGVEMASGQNRLPGPSHDIGMILADRGVTADQVKAATLEMTRANLRNGRTPPITLEQVAQWAAL